MGASERERERVQRETNVRGSEHQSPAPRVAPAGQATICATSSLVATKKEKLRRQPRQQQRRRVAALMENRLKGGQMRWPSLLELRLLQAALRNYSWVHNLISNWPTGATQLPATVATRRQQAACNTIR